MYETDSISQSVWSNERIRESVKAIRVQYM